MVWQGSCFKETGGNSFGIADSLGAKSRNIRGLIGWNMSAKGQRSDSANGHNQVSLQMNQSKAGTVS